MGLGDKILSLALFRRGTESLTRLEIVAWWELRRIPFNFIVGACGLVTCLTFFLSVEAGDEMGSSVLFLFGVLAYGIAANVCYTGGWLAELLARALWKQRAEIFGQLSLFFGLIFSMLLTFVPSIFFLFIFVLRLVQQHK